MVDPLQVLRELSAAIAPPRRQPVSTYRLQFNKDFTFDDAARLVPYFHELGVSHLYASPCFKARPGSLHGYDIIDHNSLNPEIGSEDDLARLVQLLHERGMGVIMDFVPNHMGLSGNPLWLDVLENGPASAYAGFFDIEWQPVRPELHNKVLLPILEDLYGKVLEAGSLKLALEQGTFTIAYYENRLPLDPKTTVSILSAALVPLQLAAPDNPDLAELQSIATACNNLPERTDTRQERVAERHREKEVIKRRLTELCGRNQAVQQALADELARLNGNPGTPGSFACLHELLEKQAYRLSFWRVASDEINYRRFFDINELIAIRAEDPAVFEYAHRLVRRLLRRGWVNGLRIDHVDGLFNIADYLWQLQKSYLLDFALESRQAKTPLTEHDADLFLQEAGDQLEKAHAADAADRALYVIVEKILVGNEVLRENWLMDGTTGYEFGAALNQAFVNRRHARAMREIYHTFTHQDSSFSEVLYECKRAMMFSTMSAEINMLAHRLDRISQRSPRYRDFTLNSLRSAIREIIACFPVYRTYIDAFRRSVDERDRKIINTAMGQAKKRNPGINPAIFDFVCQVLLSPAAEPEAGAGEERELFVMKFQQYTGPVMARGMEDTAFYRYLPLVSLNEVGGNPERFGITVEEFHRQNTARLGRRGSMISTATHDSKRGEDVRARINILSEIPEDWRAALNRWSRVNQAKKATVNGEPVPDRNTEYLLYQTLLGSYPAKPMTSEEAAKYLERIQAFLVKALREAKVHTSWINPNADYEQAATGFAAAILDQRDSRFLADFAGLNAITVSCGAFSSLAQTVLKVFSPGVPDTYQGNELYAYTLVDPDNRGTVDFTIRQDYLARLKREHDSGDLLKLAGGLVSDITDGRLKLYVTWKSLNYRRREAAIFEQGSYIPLEPEGRRRGNVCAFAWQLGKKILLVAAPRLLAGLTRKGEIPPLGEAAWGNTNLIIPRRLAAGACRNIFTGEVLEAIPRADRLAALPLSAICRTFPVAVLEAIPAG